MNTPLEESAENKIAISENEAGVVEVKSIISNDSGLCYVVTPKFKIQPKVNWYILLGLLDNKKKAKNRPKKVEIIITSHSNANGVVTSSWVEGIVLQIHDFWRFFEKIVSFIVTFHTINVTCPLRGMASRQ